MAGAHTEDEMKVGGSQAQRMGVLEPIAIVGMGCRLPADVNSPSELWQMLRENRSGQCRTPRSRWNVDGFYDSDPDYPGTLHHDGGYFINDDVRAFDNGFFGISKPEAISMDPEQRNLLEVVYQCLESAGAKLEDISGRNIGCYVGNFTTDYINISFKDPDSITRYGATGIGTTLLSNRISHIFNLAGPSFVLDTACSSSLYALHNACLALQAGETEAALVCGTNLLMSPEQQIAAVKAGVLSPTSTCHTFDDSADGYGRADGIGAIYIKRLSDAIRNRDPVRSIIRGTALNCNGKTFGITLPSIEGQEAVIRKAYSKDGIALCETDYVECHGTGTKVGDPIEVEALSRVFSNERKTPLLLGSVKTNVGHSEAASGIASIIKATIMLETATIPPTHGLNKINPNIKIDEWNVRVVTQNEPWPGAAFGKPRRVSINSFGYGGANAHAVLENVDRSTLHANGSRDSEVNDDDWTCVLPFSAKTQDGLLRRVGSLAQRNHVSHALIDLAYTLGCRRSFFSVRGFLLAPPCSLTEDLQEKKLVSIQGQIGPAPLPIAMIFTGQGAQWPQMGVTLLEKNASFRSTIQALDAYLQCLRDAPPWTIEQTLRAAAAESHVSHPCRSQPVCTAIQIALVDLFRRWGIVPQLVVGHSSGEIAAAYAVGHITSNEAIAIAYYRGLVVSRSTFRGAMMVVGMGEQETDAEINSASLGDGIRVACKNSPQSSTLSGDEEAIDALLQRLTSRKTFARKLRTNGIAYHSYDMANLGPAYQGFVSTYLQMRDAKTKASAPRMISSVTGKEINAAQTSNPSYWRENLESPVEFVKAISTALKDGGYFYLELGPHSMLELPLKQIHGHENVESPFLYASAIVRGTDSIKSSLNAVGSWFVSGHDVDFGRVNAIPRDDGTVPDIPAGKVLVDLPRYPWKHDTILWNESRPSTDYRFRKHSRHDLLGSIVPGGSTRSSAWRNLLRLKEVSWLEDHRLQESVVFPAAGYLAMAVEAMSRISLPLSAFSRFLFRSVHFLNALVMPSDSNAVVEILTDVHPCRISQTTDSKIWYQFEIVSVASSESTRHATGLICIDTGELPAIDVSTGQSDNELESVDPKRWYEQFSARGLKYGPRFQSIRGVYVHRARSQRNVKSDIQISRGEGSERHEESKYVLHPAIIDALLQTGLMADSCGDLGQLRVGFPVSIEAFTLTAPDPKTLARMLNVRATARQVGSGTISFDLELCDAENRFVASMHGVRIIEYVAARPDAQLLQQSPILDLIWKPDVEYLQPASYQAFVDYLHHEATLPVADDTEYTLKQLIGILDLIMHKRPACRILDIDAPSSDQDAFQDAVRATARYETLHQRCTTYARGKLGSDGIITAVDFLAGEDDQMPRQISDHDKFDVIVSRESRVLDFWLANAQHQLGGLLVDNAWILCLQGDCGVQLVASSFNVISARQGLVQPPTVARLNKSATASSANVSDHVILVVPNEQSTVVTCVAQSFAASCGTIVVALIELEKPVLSNLTHDEMQAVKAMNKRAGTMLWITGGDLLGATRPNMSIGLGLFRTMRLEHHPTKFGILDVDHPRTSAELIGQSIADVLLVLKLQPRGDDEFILLNGLLYVSRMVPRTFLNSSLASRRDHKTIQIPRSELGAAQLAIRRPGNVSTVHLQQCQRALDRMRKDEVELEVLAVGLNAKDLYTLMGRVDTRDWTTSLECTGTVRSVGEGVSNLHPGDRVVVMAPQKFSTLMRVPLSCCCKLLAYESHLEMATVPVVLSSALYALQHRAQLRPHESVLIHSATGGLGQAAIQVARMAGADVFATAGTEEKRRYLHEVLGVARNHIFGSHDTSFLADIMRETAGRGVDVILNSLSGDLLHAGWSCMAEFGRFIEVGKKDVTEAGSLDMSVFGRAASFSAFDLTDLYYSKNPAQNRVWSGLLQESVRLVRDNTCQPIQPLRVFDLSNTKQAFQFFAARVRLGKVVVDVAGLDKTSLVEVMPDRYNTSLSSHKTYLMVGCLGGIGRHLSRWMMSRGARNFIFMGRSGTDRLAAKLLVEELARAGANVKVARGDVCDADAISQAVGNADMTIGGVIQAAMNLKESLFSEMDVSDWHLGLAAKVTGTWNLHHSLRGHDDELDFFVMISSITGRIGQVTESNYSAANGFLDAFARHRRSLGLPGTSIALGAVKGIGYLAEHPEAEVILQRQGFRAMDEEELLELIDLVVYGCQNQSVGAEATIEHPSIITGLDGQNPVQRVMQDPRASLLASAVSRMSLNSNGPAGGEDSGLPKPVMEALLAGDRKALYTAVDCAVAGKLALLIQMPAEQITAQTKLADIGMDSMLAVEARQKATLGIDVSLTEFMATKATVGGIGRMVAEGLFLQFKKG